MKNILIAGAAAVLISGTAQAATVIDEVDFQSGGPGGGGDTGSILISEGIGGSFAFNGYQGSGPVVAVFVTLRAGLDGTIGVRNNTSQDQPFFTGLGTSSDVQALSPTASGPLTSLFFTRLSVAGNIKGTIRPNGSFTVDNLAGSELKSFTVANGGFSAETFDSDVERLIFSGSEITPFLTPFDIDAFGIREVAPLGSPEFPLSFSFEFRESFSAEVVYITDDGLAPVPLPSALPMLLGALGGFGYVARRRQRGANLEKI